MTNQVTATLADEDEAATMAPAADTGEPAVEADARPPAKPHLARPKPLLGVQLKVKDGRYFRTSERDGGKRHEEITNFQLCFVRRIVIDGVHHRSCLLDPAYDGPVVDLLVSPEMQTNPNQFAAAVAGRGNFFFVGTGRDLAEIFAIELADDDGRIVHRVSQVGWQPDAPIWVGLTGAYKGGVWIAPDEDGFMWDGNTGYTTEGLQGLIPRVIDAPEELGNRLWVTFAEMLQRNVGTKAIWLALGWMSALPHLRAVANEYGCYPICQISGDSKAGKTTTGGHLMGIYGLDVTKALSIPHTTPAGLRDALARSFLLVGDEYRGEDPRCAQLDSVIRSAYNFQAGLTATVLAEGRDLTPRAGVMLIGESRSTDHASRTRCIDIWLDAEQRDNSAFAEIKAMKRDLPIIGGYLIKTCTAEQEVLLLQWAEYIRDLLLQLGVDAREAINYAVAAAGFMSHVPDEHPMGAQFMDWLEETARNGGLETKSISLTSAFLADVTALIAHGAVDVPKHVDADAQHVYLWLTPILAAWEKSLRDRLGQRARSRDDVKAALKGQGYFVDGSKDRKMAGAAQKVVVLRLAEETAELHSQIMAAKSAS